MTVLVMVITMMGMTLTTMLMVMVLMMMMMIMMVMMMMIVMMMMVMVMMMMMMMMTHVVLLSQHVSCKPTFLTLYRQDNPHMSCVEKLACKMQGGHSQSVHDRCACSASPGCRFVSHRLRT